MSSFPPLSIERDSNYTPTYQEVIQWYEAADKSSRNIKMTTAGLTDSGYPLHEIVISKHGFSPAQIKSKNLPVLLINNGIHPGEPCGIDASMLFVRDLLTKPEQIKWLDDMVVVIIPVYNIGGALNRGKYSRANQVGPREYGFRGNAKNYDLNRDFVKADAANTRAFQEIFHRWDPDFFVDTHTSNGADYQYVMTLISSQSDKLGPVGKTFLEEFILPELYRSMASKNWEMIPYVNTISRGIPDYGIKAFLDYARFSSGYAALNQTWSFMPEAHMLKPYRQRVYSTLAFLQSVAEFIQKNRSKILSTRAAWKKAIRDQNDFPLDYVLDSTRVDSLIFKGYQAENIPSKVTGQQRLLYNREKPFIKKIKYYPHYKPTLILKKPKAYIIPRAYVEIIEKLRRNRVVVSQLVEDKTFKVQKYKISSLKTGRDPYEGHFLHHDVQVESFYAEQEYNAGDFWISTDQDAVRFIIETLEPQGPDSYFAWNFFDAILHQKEHFSAYVFEDLAAAMLESDSHLKASFEAKKQNDATFARDAYAQLEFIYRHSPYYEPSHRVYPVARVLD